MVPALVTTATILGLGLVSFIVHVWRRASRLKWL